jgi:hypothetical protein
LYPVPFKPFVPRGGIPFSKKDWIETDVSTPSDGRDKRPESRKVDLRSIEVLRKAEDDEIRSFIKPVISSSLKEIDDNGASLGFLKPKILDYELEIESTDLSQPQLQITADGSIAPASLIKMKQISKYKFICKDQNGCWCSNQPHNMVIHDWEVNELYRHVVEKTKDHDEIIRKMREKWFDWMVNERDTYLMMGTHHRWKNWLIVSVLYLKKP